MVGIIALFCEDVYTKFAKKVFNCKAIKNLPDEGKVFCFV